MTVAGLAVTMLVTTAIAQLTMKFLLFESWGCFPVIFGVGSSCCIATICCLHPTGMPRPAFGLTGLGLVNRVSIWSESHRAWTEKGKEGEAFS